MAHVKETSVLLELTADEAGWLYHHLSYRTEDDPGKTIWLALERNTVSEYNVGTLTTGTTEWQVRFNARTLKFYATADGYPEVRGRDWETIENNAKVQYSKSRIRVVVPYVYLSERAGRYVLREGTATGIHGANQNILAIEDGKPVQLGRFHANALSPPSAEDAARLLYLATQIGQLDRERTELTRKYAFEGGLRNAVEKAIEDARPEVTS